MGIIETAKALEIAQERRLDLVEVAPAASPPVARIMNYGKYQYQKTKKEKGNRKQKTGELKSIRLTPRISQHDSDFKGKKVEKFLNKGYRVRIEMKLRGREKAHQDFAEEKIKQFIKSIEAETKTRTIQPLKKTPQGFNIVINKS